MCTHCSFTKAQMKESWIKLHLEKNMTLLEISNLSGFHRNTLSIWKAKYQDKGLVGLIDQPKAPNSHPKSYGKSVKDKITELRTDKKNRRVIGPLTIKTRLKKRFGIEVSRSGIAKFLKSEGLIDPKKSRRNNKKNRFKKCKIHHPGELLQMDVKYAFKSYSGHWFYQYSGIDCLTRLAYGSIYELQSNFESILFTKALTDFYPFRIKGIQTDNHSTFTNRYTGYLKSSLPNNPRLHTLDLFLERLNIEHFLIDKGKPAQNGRVERFHRTCEEEFYQRESLTNLYQARKKFRDFLYYYNHEREHQGIENRTPMEELQSIPKYRKIKELRI